MNFYLGPSGNAATKALDETCEDCGRPIYWDEQTGDFRHKTDPERGCFLIAGEYTRTPQQEQELEIMRSRGEI